MAALGGGSSGGSGGGRVPLVSHSQEGSRLMYRTPAQSGSSTPPVALSAPRPPGCDPASSTGTPLSADEDAGTGEVIISTPGWKLRLSLLHQLGGSQPGGGDTEECWGQLARSPQGRDRSCPGWWPQSSTRSGEELGRDYRQLSWGQQSLPGEYVRGRTRQEAAHHRCLLSRLKRCVRSA